MQTWRSRGFWWGAVLAGPAVAWLAVATLRLHPSPGPAWLALAWLGAWAVAEELLFRGLLQPLLARTLARSSGRAGTRGSWRHLVAANVATSVLFTLAHLWRQPVAVALAVFPVSLVLGAARDLSGGVRAPLLLHVYYNACLVVASRLAGMNAG